MDSMMSSSSSFMQPELTDELESLQIFNEVTGKSFLLIDSKENLLYEGPEAFRKKLGLSNIDTPLKVISIFGNSGDGKSHVLNNVFFNGDEVFKISSEQNNCSVGISCMFQKFFYNQGILVIDTEGLNGITQNENQQYRMLMKILSVSDCIIFLTRAERLGIDMYKFLATASSVYLRHFSPLLSSLQKNGDTLRGPDLVIFHETHNTKPLTSSLNDLKPEKIIEEKFAELKLKIDAFNTLNYVGIQRQSSTSPPSDYSSLKAFLKISLSSHDRPSRTVRSVYEALDLLNETFHNDLDATPFTLHELLFTCNKTCFACNKRCENTKNHTEEHRNDSACNYHKELNNKVYYCKKCFTNGKKSSVIVQNGYWSFGATRIEKLDCHVCGEIFKARWYGNESPEATCVLADACHIWRDACNTIDVPTHSAQTIIDGFSSISETIGEMGAGPTKAITSWVADNLVNPSYWRPNHEIVCCKLCRIVFKRNGLKIHHCRQCGEGFCSNCSRSRMAVTNRGWEDRVRVCNDCRDELMKNVNCNTKDVEVDSTVRVRKYGEVLASCVQTVVATIAQPAMSYAIQSSRPEYWTKDAESPSCTICKKSFLRNPDDMNTNDLFYRGDSSLGTGIASNPANNNLILCDKRHHCRCCGKAVCGKCSLNSKPVPERGWGDRSVRVCDNCFNGKETKKLENDEHGTTITPY